MDDKQTSKTCTKASTLDYDLIEKDINHKVCYYCGSMPCDWITLKEELIAKATTGFTKNQLGQNVNNLGEVIPFSQICMYMYQMYIRIQYG